MLVNALIDFKDQLVFALGGDPTVPDSRIYRFGWFNQYTNSLYFNMYTFILSHIIALTIGFIRHLLTIRKSLREAST